jgi:histone H2B
MPPKAADKKPASKAPATASKAPEKKDAGKKTAASGEKKKRSKTRKETYSSYIYKGMLCRCTHARHILSNVFHSLEAGPP